MTISAPLRRLDPGFIDHGLIAVRKCRLCIADTVGASSVANIAAREKNVGTRE